MTYTKDEIVKEYNEAKNKKQQIRILADLNSCPREEIIAILFDSGALWTNRTTKTDAKTTKSVEPLPDVITEALSEKLDNIDRNIKIISTDIKNLESDIETRKLKIKDLEKQYTLIADFIKGGGR